MKTDRHNGRAEARPSENGGAEVREGLATPKAFGARPAEPQAETPVPPFGSVCRGGFTLVEVMLAMAVCAVVLAAINGVFFGALRLRETTNRVVDESQPAQLALTILRSDLESAVSPTTNGIMTGDFRVGDITSLGLNQNVSIEMYTTTAALHEDEPWGEIQRVTYELRSPTGGPLGRGQDLVRSVTRNLLATLTPVPEDQTMMGNVQNLTFDCYDGTQWRNTWDTTASDTNLPIAVRVTIQLAGDGPNDPRAQQPIVLLVPVDSESRTNQIPNSGS
jgi:type II secretion system protein J